MGRVIRYMVTFTTYGTYLQGHRRGYVKNGITFGESEALRKANREAQTDRRFILTTNSREIVRRAIIDETKILKQEVYAITVAETHVHIVVGEINELIETSAARYKKAATRALREAGIEGKIWTKGFDKRFCFDERALRNRINYVNRQNDKFSRDMRYDGFISII